MENGRISEMGKHDELMIKVNTLNYFLNNKIKNEDKYLKIKKYTKKN